MEIILELSQITEHSCQNYKKTDQTFKSHLACCVDRILPYQFTIKHMPGAKMGPAEYISRHPNKKTNRILTHDEEFIFAKLQFIFACAKSLKLSSIHYASHLHNLLKTYYPEPQITSQCEIVINSIKTISKLDTHLHAHAINLLLKKRILLVNTS